jgi:hypothetical protein
MDLSAITQTVRRHKFAALPVIILTFALVVYVMVLSKPDYETAGIYALVSPPPPPTPAQIAQNPALGKVNPNNPLVSYGNLSIVASMLTQAVGTQSSQHLLLADGVDSRSTVTNDSTQQVPVLTATGVGSTAAEAVHSGRLLGQVLSNELNSIQARLSVSPGYRITLYPLDVPDQASLKLSSKLRNLIGVLALGVILLWVSVSVAVARAARKNARVSSARAPDSAALQASQGVPPMTGGHKGAVASGANGNGPNPRFVARALDSPLLDPARRPNG